MRGDWWIGSRAHVEAMTTYAITYLGGGEVVLPVMDLRRWPVALGARASRSTPGEWSEAKLAEAEHWAVALRVLVLVAKERRAWARGRLYRGLDGRCHSEILNRLTCVLPTQRMRRDGLVPVVVDGTKVFMRGLGMEGSRGWRMELPDLLRDELVIDIDEDQLRMRVAPVGMDQAGAELYGALRAQGIEVGEAALLVGALGGS